MLCQTFQITHQKTTIVLKELKDKVRYKEVIAADTEFYLEELDKIWKKLEVEQKEAQNSLKLPNNPGFKISTIGHISEPRL